MGKSELQTSYADWSRRVAKYEAAGIPNTVWSPIATQDMTKTYQAGSTPMTNAEADIAVYSAWKGSSAVQEAPRHGGGFFGDIEHIASNIVPDIGNIITALPRGIAELGKELVTPSTYSNTAKDIGEALQAFGSGQYGQATRDIAQSPLLDLVPGVNDLADLTTSAGRTSLMEHPVTAALDVLPITKGLSAGLGKVAGIEKGAEGAAGALRAGKPVSALAQGIDAQVLGGRGGRITQKALSKVHLDARNRSLSSAVTRRTMIAEQNVGRFTSGQLEQIFGKLGGLDAEIAYQAKAEVGDIASMTPVERAVFDQHAALQMKMTDDVMKKGELVQTEYGIYNKNTPVVKAVGARERLAQDHSGYADEVTQAEERVNAAKAEQARAVTAAQQVLTILQHGGYKAKAVKDQAAADLASAQKGYKQAKDDLVQAEKAAKRSRQRPGPKPSTYEVLNARRKVTSAGDQVLKAIGRVKEVKHFKDDPHISQTLRDRVEREVRKANTEMLRAQNAHAQALSGLKDYQSDLKKANEKVDKALVRMSGSGVPGHLHATVQQLYSQRLQDALEKQRVSSGASLDDHIDVSGLPETRVLSTYNEAFKELSDPNSHTGDQFREYLGKDETKALFSDAVNEAIKLSREGLSPVFLHATRGTEADQIMSVHLARAQDVSEAQTKSKLFNLSKSVLSPRLGLTEQMAEIERRDGMQELHDTFLSKWLKPREEVQPIYRKSAETRISKGKYKGLATGKLADELMAKEWVKFDYGSYGIRRSLTAGAKSTDMMLPKNLADNLESFAGNARSNLIFQNAAYRTGMSIFRTSVLYGPRHFAHVVIGGMMPLVLAEPSAFLEFPGLWGNVRAMYKGEPLKPIQIGGRSVEIPQILTTRFDYKTDSSYKMLQTKIGHKYGELWQQTGAKPGEILQKVEDTAQSLYQQAVFAREIRRGMDPMIALEHARDFVVNLDGMSPFERTVLKQVFPFYSFTRFAVKFLAQLPFDHPLRVAILSQLSNQAQQEWGTGLPQTMMSLFFIGSPDAKGNIASINTRNMNPFRSISNMFTIAGIMESANPALTAPFVAMGYNPLSGSGQMYPEVVYDAQTGSLVAARPKGDMMQAAEQFVPELGAIDAYFGISDNLRTLKQSDQGAFDRELMNMFNIPFAYSNYNLPQTRGRVAKDAYIGAQHAVTAYKKTGDFSNTIGRYNLVPLNGQMVSPAQFRAYWEQQVAAYQSANPGAYVGALIPKVTPPTTNILAELQQYYGGQSG